MRKQGMGNGSCATNQGWEYTIKSKYFYRPNEKAVKICFDKKKPLKSKVIEPKDTKENNFLFIMAIIFILLSIFSE